VPKYLVETVSMFCIRYVVDCESAEHAKDTVVMQDAQEFSQIHIDENVISCRELMTDAEIPTMFFEEHDYLIGSDTFTDDFILENYVCKVSYDE
jgi:hypothetical protein